MQHARNDVPHTAQTLVIQQEDRMVLLVLEGTVSPETILTEREHRDCRLVPIQHRLHWVLGRLAAKQAIRELLRCTDEALHELSDIEIVRTRSGAPECRILTSPGQQNPSTSRVALSISHAGAVAAAIASLADRVGVDIEPLRDFGETTARAFLTEAEYAKLASIRDGEERRRYLTLAWCAKEAYLKAIGTGIRTHPYRVDVRQGQQNGTLELLFDGNPVCACTRWTSLESGYILVYVHLC